MNKRLIRFSPKIYQHPFDAKALASLEKMPGLSLVLNKVNEYGIDRLLRTQILSSRFQVTPRNFPKLYDTFIETCEILDVNPSPELYLSPGMGRINTYSIGVEKPIVGINLEGMEWLSPEELLFAFGHELLRVKGSYINYQQIASAMPLIKELISSTTFGLGGIAVNGLEVALMNWTVMSKFTCDRAGLLACQNLDVAITALMKLGGLPEEYLKEDTIKDFEAQARTLMTLNLDNLDRVTKIFSFMDAHFTWVVMRMAELLKWVDSGDYQSLMSTGKLPEKAATLSEKTEELPEKAEELPETSDSSDNPSDWDFLSTL